MHIILLPPQLLSYFCDSSIKVDDIGDEDYMLGFNPSTITNKQLLSDLNKITGYDVTTLTQINFSQNLEYIEFHRIGKENKDDFLNKIKIGKMGCLAILILILRTEIRIYDVWGHTIARIN